MRATVVKITIKIPQNDPETLHGQHQFGASWLLILSLGLAKFLAVEAEKAVLRRLQVRSM